MVDKGGGGKLAAASGDASDTETSVSGVFITADLSTLTDTPDAAAERAARLTPCGVLRSKFVIGQTIFNMAASFAGPLAVFWLLFSAGGPYAWNSGEVLGPILASPWACAIASSAFAPISMGDAVASGWFGCTSPESVQRLSWVFPFLGTHRCWRYGALRHLILGTQVAVVFIPLALLIARYGLGPSLDAWEQIWLSIIYITLLPLVIMPLALLAFAVKPNLERVHTIMPDHPNALMKLMKRAACAPLC
eukprot:jgi/Tetstr1/423146/TSEL_013914.t1